MLLTGIGANLRSFDAFCKNVNQKTATKLARNGDKNNYTHNRTYYCRVSPVHGYYSSLIVYETRTFFLLYKYAHNVIVQYNTTDLLNLRDSEAFNVRHVLNMGPTAGTLGTAHVNHTLP